MNPKITIFDHNTHPIWNRVYETRHKAFGRTNGGYTYSEDIVKYHIPEVRDLLERSNYKHILITTVGELNKNIVPKDVDLIIYYLHENSQREMPRIKLIGTWYKGKIIYITARLDLYTVLVNYYYNVIHLPMSIDKKAFEKYANRKKYTGKRVVYFGNTYLGKGAFLEYTKNIFKNSGWEFDQISYNCLNGVEKLSRSKLLETLSKYQYGIGEGRCVLEMNAMGIKTLICASANQGIMCNDDDFELQKKHNFADGRVWTFSDDILTCIDNFDSAIIKTVDVKDVMQTLKQQLGVLL